MGFRCAWISSIKHVVLTPFSGTIVKNLEACNVVKSSHFNMASELLEVCVVFGVFFPSNTTQFDLVLPAFVCSRLPQVNPTELGKCLTQRSFMTARESVTKALTISQAMDGRDAFVKVTPPPTPSSSSVRTNDLSVVR